MRFTPAATGGILVFADGCARCARPGQPGRSAVRLARTLWEREVPGSNPGAPTSTLRAWCSGNIKPFQGSVTGSNPVARLSVPPGPIAQRQSRRLITAWLQVRILLGPTPTVSQKDCCLKPALGLRRLPGAPLGFRLWILMLLDCISCPIL